VIAVETLNLRTEPSEAAAADPFGLAAGDIVSLGEERGGWWFVTVPDGRSGWVKGTFIEVMK
jgi:SH3-like domain-containing protein